MLISWSVNPKIWVINLGFIHIQLSWYGLLMALAFVLGYQLTRRQLVRLDRSADEVEPLALAMFLGVLIGARLGHCLFYQPLYYLSHPLEILKTWEGGLASHGAVIGILLALWLHSRRHSHPLAALTDLLSPAIALASALIRLGNLMNSEILGIPTSGSWGVRFMRIDGIPRHPVQVYESLWYLVIFAILMVMRKRQQTLAPGRMTGLMLTLIFSGRFLLEFLKEAQADFAAGPLHMGQWLSLPCVVIGVCLLLRNQTPGTASIPRSAGQSVGRGFRSPFLPPPSSAVCPWCKPVPP